jgi:16S rRNA G966 N2-methylase RsmD
MILDAASQQFIRDHYNDDLHRLLLSAAHYPALDIPFIVRQIEGLRMAKTKLPEIAANSRFVYPAKISMEQCSSEQTAKYKARLAQGAVMADLTGGLGIDAYYFSKEAKSVVYIEQNKELAEIARHNFPALEANIETVNDDGIRFLIESNRTFDLLYLDPARRDSANRKMVSLEDCEPDVLKNSMLLFGHAPRLLVKASPMLDISLATKKLGNIATVHVVAVKNECKEILFECNKNHTFNSFSIHCTNLGTDKTETFSFKPDEEEEATAIFTNETERYLYEPNASILKAGAFKLIAQRFNLKKLHRDTHLYTSNRLQYDFPGRIFEVLSCFQLNQKELAQILPERKANISVRNFPMAATDICRKHKIKDGGDLYLFGVTFSDEKRKAILCRKKVNVRS